LGVVIGGGGEVVGKGCRRREGMGGRREGGRGMGEGKGKRGVGKGMGRRGASAGAADTEAED